MPKSRIDYIDRWGSYLLMALAILLALAIWQPPLHGWGTLPSWDGRAHLLKALHWGKYLVKYGHFDGWFPYWHGGFDVLAVYPPLLTFILAFFASFLDPLVALRAVMLLLLLGLVPVGYSFFRRFGLGRPASATMASLLLILTPNFSAGIVSTVRVGLLAHGLGFLLVLWVLGRLWVLGKSHPNLIGHLIWTSMSLSLLVLSHSISCYWMTGAGIILVGTQLKFKMSNWRLLSVRLIFLIGASIFLTMFWLVPFLLHVPNMPTVQGITEYPTAKLLSQILFLNPAGGLPIFLLTLLGLVILALNKKWAEFTFILGTMGMTMLIVLNVANQWLPFGKPFTTGQQIRFEGFFYPMAFLAAGFALQWAVEFSKRFTKNYVWAPYPFLAFFILIYLAPSFSTTKSIFKPILIPQEKTLASLSQFLDNNLNLGEFILSEMNWTTANTYGTPHFINQNLPRINSKVWDLNGSLPEANPNPWLDLTVSQNMKNSSVIQKNLPRLKERGVRYFISASREAFNTMKEMKELKLVWNSQSIQAASEDSTIGPEDDLIAVFEVTDQNSILGLPASALKEFSGIGYGPPGLIYVAFKNPVSLPPNTGLGVTAHPWHRVRANQRPLRITRGLDSELTLVDGAVNFQVLEIEYHKPLILRMLKWISLAVFSILLVMAIRPTLVTRTQLFMKGLLGGKP